MVVYGTNERLISTLPLYYVCHRNNSGNTANGNLPCPPEVKC